MSTYTPIASQTLASAAASVTFSSIPQGYTDLVLIVNGGMSSGAAYVSMQLNGDTTMTNYSVTYFRGDGTDIASNRYSGASGRYNVSGIPITTTTLTANIIFQFQNYSNPTTYKTVLNRVNDTVVGTSGSIALWRNTNAINQIVLREADSGANWLTGTTFSLYGIAVGDKAQKAQGGNIVTTDGTYVYHTFTSSGLFTPSAAITADYLVVAGGGGGGSNGGGGGAGGLRSTVTATGGGGSLETALSLISGTSYPVVIGAGGVGGVSATYISGDSGNDSVFSTIISTGGGGASGADGLNGKAGGSGGGGGWGGGIRTGGAGTANQGFAGGTSTSNLGGGGGGASTVGATAGNGGSGVATSITGSSTTYAGGGGGGSNADQGNNGGSGGGGRGNYVSVGAGTNGTPATGGGGGGGGTNGGAGGNGGSGVVVIRYLA